MNWLRQWVGQGNRAAWLAYLGLAMVVMFPLLAPGFVLTLDMVFTPYLSWPSEVRSSYLFHAALHLLGFIIPADWLQKIILLGILVLSGVGAHLLWRALQPKAAAGPWQLTAYFAGSLYMVNPFVYDRFMAGQYSVLMGYALLPWFVRSLMRLVESPSWRSALTLAGWLVAISIVSIHTLGAAVLLGVCVAVVGLWQHRHSLLTLRRAGLWLGVAAAGFIVASSYWLVPLVSGNGPIAQHIQQFDDGDYRAFAVTGGDTGGAISKVLRLQGFWGEDTGQFVLPQDKVELWGLLGLVFVGLAITGIVVAWRRKQHTAVALAVVAVITGILVVNGGLLAWLTEHIPLLAGYREPHKLVMVVALAYAVLGAFGVAVLLGYVRRGRSLAFIAVLLLPWVWTPTMIWGFNGQLHPTFYPDDWRQVRQMLPADSEGGRVLFLPWHQYMTFGFAGRIIASPAEQFFGPSIVASHDPEYGGLGPDPAFPFSKDVQDNVIPHAQSTSFGRRAAAYGLGYILLAKEFDHHMHSNLANMPGIEVMFDGPTLTLYHIQGGEQ